MAEPYFQQAAVLWVDMERGLYDWGEKKQPRSRDGKPLVRKELILKAVGLSPRTHNPAQRIWNNPEFLQMLKEERRRRDIGICDLVAEVEKQVTPFNETYKVIDENIAAVFARMPDSEDPMALSPRDYVHEGLAVMKHIEEQEGRSASLNAKGFDAVIASVGANVTGNMVREGREILEKMRRIQDQRLEQVMDGELAD